MHNLGQKEMKNSCQFLWEFPQKEEIPSEVNLQLQFMCQIGKFRAKKL